MIRLTIPGEVVPQGRPRFARRGNFIQTYDPKECRDYKAYVALIAKQHRPPQPFAGAVSMRIRVYRYTPQSWAKKKMAAALTGQIRPTSKPDLDNVAKGIKDALKGIIWVDDSQVVRLEVEKWYSDNPRAEVEIEEIEKGLFGGE